MGYPFEADANYSPAVTQQHAQLQYEKQQSERKFSPSAGVAPQQQESLASVTPRVINLSQESVKMSQSILSSLGIHLNLAAPMDGDTPPTLMNALLLTEIKLREALGYLQAINIHING